MQDTNFRATVWLLLYESGWAKKDIDALARKHKVRNRDDENLHPAIEEYLYTAPFAPGALESLAEFKMPFKAVRKVMPLWGGEEYPFFIRSFGDVSLLPALQSFEWYEYQFETEVAPLLAHPSLRRISLSSGPNGTGIAQLAAAGWAVQSQDPFGQTVLVRGV